MTMTVIILSIGLTLWSLALKSIYDITGRGIQWLIHCFTSCSLCSPWQWLLPYPHTHPTTAVKLLLSGPPLTSMLPDPVDPPPPSWQTQSGIPSLKHLPLVSFPVSLSGFTLSMFQPECKHLGYPWLVSRPSCFPLDALSPLGWLIHSRIYGDVCEEHSWPRSVLWDAQIPISCPRGKSL